MTDEEHEIYQEFKDCNSAYYLSEKDSDELSLDDEFNDANKILDLNEDDSYINYLENQNFMMNLSCNKSIN